LEIQVLTWDRHKNMAGLNWFMVSQPSPSRFLAPRYVTFTWFVIAFTKKIFDANICHFYLICYCACPKSEPGFPTSCIMVFFLCPMSWGEKWLFRFIDIGEILFVDHHCLNFHNMLRLVKKGWHFTKQLLWLLYVCDGKMLLFCAIIIIFIKISFDYITEKGGMWCPKLSFHLTNHHHI
jgi:hypothetical protein